MSFVAMVMTLMTGFVVIVPLVMVAIVVGFVPRTPAPAAPRGQTISRPRT